MAPAQIALCTVNIKQFIIRSQVLETWRPEGGVLQSLSEEDDQWIFSVSNFPFQIFWGRKIWQMIFGCLDISSGLFGSH